MSDDNSEDEFVGFAFAEVEAPAYSWSWLAPLCWLLHLLEGILRAFADVAAEAGQDIDAAYNADRSKQEFLDEARIDIEKLPVVPNG